MTFINLRIVQSKHGISLTRPTISNKLVVQLVIIYRSETWVMTPRIGIILGILHHRVAHEIMGRRPQIVCNGLWVYPPLEDAMAEAVFQEVQTYVSLHQNKVAQFIATRPIMYLSLEVDRGPG